MNDASSKYDCNLGKPDHGKDVDDSAAEDNADDAEEYAEEAYDNARKAYYADNLEDAQYYVKKAMNAAEEAQEEAGRRETAESDNKGCL